MSTDRYVSPLSERYASKEMQYIFSPDKKFSTWRKLWIALAETEMELGLSMDGKPVITKEMIDELKAHIDDINYDVAKEREKVVRHDVRISPRLHLLISSPLSLRLSERELHCGFRNLLSIMRIFAM